MKRKTYWCNNGCGKKVTVFEFIHTRGDRIVIYKCKGCNKTFKKTSEGRPIVFKELK